MAIKPKVQQILNEQINHEIYSAYLYLAMAAYFTKEGWNGFAHWMKKQASEEMEHAMKIFDYLYERQGEVSLMAIAKPKLSWVSPLAAFKEAYEHELKVTDLINKCFDVAVAQKDRATESFLEWFIDEQVEEEASADEIVQKLKMVKGSPNGLFILNKELAQRK